MKDALLIMEHTCKQDIKKLCIIYIVYFITAVACVFYHQIDYRQNFQIPFALLPLLFFLAITRLHRKRIKGMLADGAFHRILLLPVRRSALLTSEFLFTFASYALLLLIPVVIWYLWFLCFQQQLVPYQNQLLLYSLTQGQASLMIPYDLAGSSYLLMFLVSLTFIMNYLHLSFAIKVQRPIGIVSLVFATLVLSMGNDLVMIKVGALLVMSILLWFLLCKLMGVTFKKTNNVIVTNAKA